MSERLPVVGGALRDGDRVLLAQRPPGGRHGLLWEFPGGKVEAGESDAEALRRELREELGISVEVGALLGRGIDEGGLRPIELRVYSCRLLSGEPRCLGVHALRWVRIADGIDESAALPFPPADLPALEALRALAEPL